MNGRADRIAAPTQVEDRHFLARAVWPVLGRHQEWGRVAQQAGVDGVQGRDDGEYAGEKEDRDYVRAMR